MINYVYVLLYITDRLVFSKMMKEKKKRVIVMLFCSLAVDCSFLLFPCNGKNNYYKTPLATYVHTESMMTTKEEYIMYKKQY